MNGQKILIHFAIGFIVSLIILMYAVVEFLQIEVEGNVMLFVLGISLFMGLISIAKHKGRTHFGHLPLVLGLLGIVVGGGFLYGNIESEALGKSQWWNIEDIDKKTVLGVIAVFGFIFTMIGLKGMAGAWFFLRPFGQSRR